jgi:hypothetical protein
MWLDVSEIVHWTPGMRSWNLTDDLRRRLATFPPDVQSTLLLHEEAGTTDDPNAYLFLAHTRTRAHAQRGGQVSHPPSR